MERINDLLDRWPKEQESGWVVATILSVKGHSYRKPGAVMLFGPEGQTAGSLSPGCLEADLAEHAREIWSSGAARTIAYEMDDLTDPSWGETAFCGGSLTVLLEPLAGAAKEAFLQLKRWVDQGWNTELARLLDRKGRLMAYRVTREDGPTKRYGLVARSYRSYRTTYKPRPRLLIFGLNRDVQPVVELAQRIGFYVVAADWRGWEASQQSATSTGCWFNAPIEALLELAKPAHGDRVLLMSHQYRQDRFLLEQLIKTPVRYIGLLGSRARATRLLDGLPSDSRIHAPVGLAIGASGPDQIAVSIAAELIKDLNVESRGSEANQEQPWRLGGNRYGYGGVKEPLAWG